MPLLKAPRKQPMREYYLKPPAKGKTTAFICYQYYDRIRKETIGIPYASFNQATTPEAPEINITKNGAAAGYTVSAEDLIEVKKWLKRNGTYGKAKVPPRVLARVRAEVETKVRAELGIPLSTPASMPAQAPAKAPVPTTVGDKIRALCAATDALLEQVTAHVTPKESLAGLTAAELFALRLHLNFGERALRYALKKAGVSATDFAPVMLVGEAEEALRRGYIKNVDIEAARQARAKSKTSKKERESKAGTEKNGTSSLPLIEESPHGNSN